MNALGWTVVGSVAGVVGAVCTVWLAVFPFFRNRRRTPESEITREPVPAVAESADPVRVGDIPQRPLGFQPRPDLLAALDGPARGQRVVVVHAVTGMRGVGKTQLAAAYARARLADRWRLAVWINAEDAGTLMAGLAEVAVKLGLKVEDAAAAGRAVRHRLETDGHHCLLVLDNVTEPELVQPFLPVSGESRVIITSNQQSVTHLGASVPVEVFTEAEALAYLTERTGRDHRQGAVTVAVELGFLPLALAQAAAVIAEQHLDYGTYLERLRRMQVSELLAPVKAGQYPRGVAAAVLLSLVVVQSPDDAGGCGPVMDLLAVLSPAGVRRPILHALCQAGFPWQRRRQRVGLNAAATDRALGRLAGASLLTFSVDGTNASAHRLVLRVVRERLVTEGRLTRVCVAAAGVLDELAESLRDSWHRDRPAVRDLIEQITALGETADQYPADEDLGRRLIRLRGWSVLFLNDLRDSSAQAISIGERVLADAERVLGPDHPDTLLLRSRLAAAYYNAGRSADAILLQEQVLADRQRVLGPDDPDTLVSRSNLAAAYRAAGRSADAIRLHEQVLADMERLLDPDAPDTLTTRDNLANAYQEAGRTVDAIPLFEQVLADRERKLGPDHPDTLMTRDNLGLAYQRAGRTAEAIPLHEQALADAERLFGPEHLDTLISRNNLGLAYRRAGRTAEAIPLHERTLDDAERLLGPDHLLTLASRYNLGLAYQEAGRTSEAIPLFEQALADRQRVLGPYHPDTLTSRSSLAAAYQEAGRTSEAIPLFEQALEAPNDSSSESSDL